MEFLNDPVPVEQLPRQEQVELLPIEPSYLKVLRIWWLLGSLGLAVVGLTVLYISKQLHSALYLSLVGGLWLLFVTAWFWLQGKGFSTKAYSIRERDIIYRTGWIIEHTRTCPFNRIQHIEVSMGPWERYFGLASLVLYTAGANDADLSVSGLKEDQAWKLKELITKKITDEGHAAPASE